MREDLTFQELEGWEEPPPPGPEEADLAEQRIASEGQEMGLDPDLALFAAQDELEGGGTSWS